MATQSIRLSDGTNTLLPESATSGSGYQKDADGTLKCWGRATSDAIAANSSGTKSVTFPISFNSTPRITATPLTASPFTRSVGISSPSTTGFTMNFQVTSAASSVSADWIAIGRWK